MAIRSNPGLTVAQRIERLSVEAGSCRLWVGMKNGKGYGRMTLNGRLESAHRVAWSLIHGAIPSHLEMDHLCRNRSCVNVEHLQLLTHADNVRKRTKALACRKGHLFTLENTGYSGGVRYCRICQRAYARYLWSNRPIPAWRSETRHCRKCLAPFSPQRPWQLFCDHRCKEAARDERRHTEHHSGGKAYL